MTRTAISALLAASILALAGTTALAETTPRPGSHDNRVRVATWTEGQVYSFCLSPPEAVMR